MAELPSVPERRAYKRQKLRVSAFVERQFGSPLPCVVLDLSPNSARIDASELSLPDSFVMMMKLSTNIRRYCKVIWRSGYSAGVQFVAWPAARQ